MHGVSTKERKSYINNPHEASKAADEYLYTSHSIQHELALAEYFICQ